MTPNKNDCIPERSSNVDPAFGGIEELQRVIKIIRSRWQNVKIIIRGDSAYSREEIMAN